MDSKAKLHGEVLALLREGHNWVEDDTYWICMVKRGRWRYRMQEMHRGDSFLGVVGRTMIGVPHVSVTYAGTWDLGQSAPIATHQTIIPEPSPFRLHAMTNYCKLRDNSNGGALISLVRRDGTGLREVV